MEGTGARGVGTRRLSRRQLVAGSAALALISGTGQRRAVAQSPAVSIERGSTSDRVVALTFDCGSSRGYAGMILDTLASDGVKASFGVTGRWAESNGDLVQRMVAEGHTLINHTYSHRSFTGASTAAGPLSSWERTNEIQTCEQILVDLTGVGAMPYFRPPYGDYDGSVLADLGYAGYAWNVLWTLDVLGWDGLSQGDILWRVEHNHGNGYIYLMHVGAESQEGPALPGIISFLRDQGYGFVTIPQLIGGGTPTQPRFAIGDGVRTTGAVNLRSGPGTDTGIIAVLDAGTTGTVVDGPRSGSGYVWWQIETNRGTGWVAQDWLEGASLVDQIIAILIQILEDIVT